MDIIKMNQFQTNIQNRESMNNWNTNRYTALLKGVVYIFMFLSLMGVTEQLNAQCTNQALVCNNLVRVSLDTSCMVQITPDVVLKDLNIDTSLYRVEVRDPDGNIIPNALIMDDYDGQRLEVRVYCKDNNLYCWGSIIVEDKIPPTIEITPCDTTLSCIVMPFELDPNALITSISFTDEGCEKPDTFMITDFNETIFPCDDTVKVITRVFTIYDAAGNSASKTQTIKLLRGELNEIIYPQDTIIDCLDEADLSPAKLGEPFIGVCEHFDISSTDVEIPVCGVSRKILRRWRVTDICTARDTIVTQVIKIEDNHGPEFSFMNFDIPEDKIVPSKFDCTADIIGINNPVITDCNLVNTTVTVGLQYTNEAGDLIGGLFPAVMNDILSEPDAAMTGMIIWDFFGVDVARDFKVIFVADDGCGNITRDTSGVFNLPDLATPNAVCEGNTTVVLNTDGVTEVMASSFDDNSFDNCGIVKREVRRFNSSCAGFGSDESFGDRIHFCCEDIANNPIKVVFRVSDASGGFSDCIVNVFVQDKRPITIACANTLEVDCGTDSLVIDEMIKNAPPTVEWVCGEKSLEVEIPNYTIDACGGGSFEVVWTAMDFNGQMATCTRTVLVRNEIDATVVRPQLEITLSSCTAGTMPDDIPNSRPTVEDVDCENIAISWDDEIVETTGTTCYKIVRTWAVIDWCKFDGGNVETGIIDQFEQTILITDNNVPVISCPTEIIEDDVDETCDELVTINVSATDDCTPSDQLTYTWIIDVDNDNTDDIGGEGPSATGTYPVGTHSITFFVTDLCGNIGECTFPFTVVGQKAPLPLCVGLVEAVIGQDGFASITAESLNVKSTTGCTLSEENLTFSFSEDGTQETMFFSCTDIPNGIFAEQTVDLWVIDNANGAAAACEVIISISDRQNNACADNTIASAISGVITDEEMAIVANVPVFAKNRITGEVMESMSDENGYYSFSNLPGQEDYQISAEFEGYPLAGISTLDLVVIQQHILGIKELDSPYKYIAADVNNSQSISAIDLVSLRLLILGVTNEMPNDNWKFVDRDFEFDMQVGPWVFADHIWIDNSSAVENDKDFIGLKVGDVTGNAFTAVAQGTAGSRSTSAVKVTPTRNGNVVRYAFNADKIEEMIGLQMAIEIPRGTSLAALGSDILNLKDEYFTIANDELRISWTNDYAQEVAGETLFFLDLEVNGNEIPVLKTVNKNILPEYYSASFETTAIALSQEALESEIGLTVRQNQPNPFTDQTVISFTLPKAEQVEFSITDISGKVIRRSSQVYNKGLNTIRIQSGDLGGTGVFYYSITTATAKETKRMIVLN